MFSCWLCLCCVLLVVCGSVDLLGVACVACFVGRRVCLLFCVRCLLG